MPFPIALMFLGYRPILLRECFACPELGQVSLNILLCVCWEVRYPHACNRGVLLKKKKKKKKSTAVVVASIAAAAALALAIAFIALVLLVRTRRLRSPCSQAAEGGLQVYAFVPCISSHSGFYRCMLTGSDPHRSVHLLLEGRTVGPETEKAA